MAYRLHSTERVGEGIRRILAEELDGAVAALAAREDLDASIHDARKRCKKVRAVLRLVRDAIDTETYRRENRRCRDAGRRLAEVRDGFVFVETVGDLLEEIGAATSSRVLEDLRGRLVKRHQRAVGRVVAGRGVASEVIAELGAAQGDLRALELDRSGFDAFSGGLERTYRRGARGMRRARSQPTTDRFHAWRKRVKDLWYVMELLGPPWKGSLSAVAEGLDPLASLLGTDHDLAGLRGQVAPEPRLPGGDEELLLHAIDRRRRELQDRVWPLAERVYDDQPQRFVAEAAAQFEAWRGSAARDGASEPRSMTSAGAG